MNRNYDNINQLRDLSKKLEKDNQFLNVDKEVLNNYLKDMDKDNKYNILEFNISKKIAKEKRD